MWTIDTYYQLQKALAFIREQLDEVNPYCMAMPTIEQSNRLWRKTLRAAKETAVARVEGEVDRAIVRAKLDIYYEGLE